MTDSDLARPQADQALVSDQAPQAGLAPSGFDPSREDTYRGWTIYYEPPPIPIRNFDWHGVGPNYDASYEGPEDGGWVDNGEKASAPTREALIVEIDNWFEENGDD